MKFLGIRNGHDQNITYTDGTRVRYAKLERNFQQKHYNFNHAPGDDIVELIDQARKLFGVNTNELNGICISNGFSTDVIEHKFDRYIQLDELWFQVDKNKNKFWDQFPCPVYHIDHHYSHTLSCWPLIDLSKVKTHFVIDGLGCHARSLGVYQNDEIIEFIDRYENMGLSVTMEQIGQALKMKGMVLDLSGKLMALKSYHNMPPELTRAIMHKVKILKYRNLNQFIDIVKQVVQNAMPNATEDQRLINLSYMLHVFAEEKLPPYMDKFVTDRNEPITYSGGTAQNTVVNTKIREWFPNIQIPPHCPDDGISLGCVEFLRKQFDQPLFDNSNFPYWQSDEAPPTTPTQETINKTAEMLAQGKIVGWYQGNGEVGPRALGNRSILMDPSIKGGKDILNKKVKKREEYRPFGASVLLEDTPKLFKCDYESPYMLYVVDCLNHDYASIEHVDGTCRVQTVNEQPQYAIYRSLIQKFKDLTGIPMVLNTSLNVDGKPIAGFMEDAKTVFEKSEMDAVVIGNEILTK